jgi:hypothetical protein
VKEETKRSKGEDLFSITVRYAFARHIPFFIKELGLFHEDIGPFFIKELGPFS